VAVQLRSLLNRPATTIWAVLMAATIVSWTVGTSSLDARLATVAVLIVAIIKVRFVGLYFMELRDAVIPLRLIFEGFCVVLCAGLVVMYLTGT
jgi:caa(3)-type oxidase subunit IV